jgi:decaprenyl-phosphate phosphoribosyltransferase
MIKGLLKEARPKQWAKNVLVFAAPGAAGVLTHEKALLRTVIIFIAFCMASAGTYYWNDILDVEADRVHVRKRFRPIASGAVPLGVAKVVGSLLLALGPALAFTTRWQAGVACIVYVLVTTMYTVVLKHIAVVDLVAVAAGFVVRAIAGATATNVPMSSWFVLCTSFGSLLRGVARTRRRTDQCASHPRGLLARVPADRAVRELLRNVGRVLRMGVRG